MEQICEPAAYELITTSVQRTGRGKYKVLCYHRHVGSRSYCPNDEVYDELCWGEALDVVVAVVEGRRPGMHPDGWEQQPLF